jgi:hypothetical protein
MYNMYVLWCFKLMWVKNSSQNIYVEKISVCHAMIKNLGSVWLLFHIEACYHILISITRTDNFIIYPRMSFGKT